MSPTFTSIFAYDGDNLIETVNSSGAVVSRYAQGQNIDEPLAELRSAGTDYYEADGLGSVTSLTSGAGALVQMTSPSFCTTGSERVYITTSGREIGFGGATGP